MCKGTKVKVPALWKDRNKPNVPGADSTRRAAGENTMERKATGKKGEGQITKGLGIHTKAPGL